MNWKQLYESRSVEASEAIKVIKDGDHVVFSDGAAIPQHIASTLAQHKDDYNNVFIYHMLALGNKDYLMPECYGHFRHQTNFVCCNSRQAILDHQADYAPLYFKDVPEMLGNAFPVDVAVLSLSRPNEEGYCSFGVSCDYSVAAARKAKIVIAEINERTPFTYGPENRIHVSEIDYFVHCCYELPSYPLPPIGEVEKAIGRHCASLIHDGATLQLGIGAIPEALLLSLTDKHDLGIHTEMFSDGVVDLMKAGVITNAKKTLHQGKTISTFVTGTRKLYDFIDNNPDVELYPVDHVNDPWVIGKNDNMISVNSCIEVDLTGQVTSEMIGEKQYSGPGGQVDFVRGAMLSKGGISIIAVPSTAKHGTLSRIVPYLKPGAAVTTSRNDVDYVVTEYGVAKLRGMNLQQRAENLIAVAHPSFREELKAECKRRYDFF